MILICRSIASHCCPSSVLCIFISFCFCLPSFALRRILLPPPLSLCPLSSLASHDAKLEERLRPKADNRRPEKFRFPDYRPPDAFPFSLFNRSVFASPLKSFPPLILFFTRMSSYPSASFTPSILPQHFTAALQESEKGGRKIAKDRGVAEYSLKSVVRSICDHV